MIEALGRNNGNIGAGYIEQGGEQYLIRAPGQVSGIEEVQTLDAGISRMAAGPVGAGGQIEEPGAVRVLDTQVIQLQAVGEAGAE